MTAWRVDSDGWVVRPATAEEKARLPKYLAGSSGFVSPETGDIFVRTAGLALLVDRGREPPADWGSREDLRAGWGLTPLEAGLS